MSITDDIFFLNVSDAGLFTLVYQLLINWLKYLSLQFKKETVFIDNH